jgi:hypothetical protein
MAFESVVMSLIECLQQSPDCFYGRVGYDPFLLSALAKACAEYSSKHTSTLVRRYRKYINPFLYVLLAYL